MSNDRISKMSIEHISDVDLIRKVNQWINTLTLEKISEQGTVDTADWPDDLDVVLAELVRRFDKLRSKGCAAPDPWGRATDKRRVEQWACPTCGSSKYHRVRNFFSCRSCGEWFELRPKQK